MTPETETASPAAGINCGDSIDSKITCASDTSSKSSGINGFQGRGQGGCVGRGSHQGHDGRGR